MKIKTNLFLLVFFIGFLPMPALSQAVTFPSSQLQSKALELSGSELNWPILFKLATHNTVTNEFSLAPDNVQQLRNFSRVTLTIDRARTRINELIEGGASIFAKEQLQVSNTLMASYLNEVKTGNIDQATLLAEQIKPEVIKLDSVLTANRLVDVQAQLDSKDGEVDKRKGLLGSWEDAIVGDLFKETDGLQTYEDSYASMAFVDGSNIIVNPNTVAVIRKSRIDKLDESSDTEVTLVEGGLLAKLSAAGKDKGNFILRTGGATSDLNTINFLAEVEDSRAKLTNYDGEAMITANDLTITIRKNEGTIVEQGQDPLPPIQLLPAPDLVWAKADTIIYTDQIIYTFASVPDAVEYHIQYSTSPNFDGEVRDITLTNTSINIQDLPLGTSFIQVQAVDKLGLKGPYSKTTRVIRNIDNKPPPLFITSAPNGIIFTTGTQITLTGISEPDASISINGEQQTVRLDGSFTTTIPTSGVDQSISINATDDSGNETVRQVRIIKLTEEVLFNLVFQGASQGTSITVDNNPVTISGKAYPELEVLVENNGISKLIRTDSIGRWGITLPLQGSSLKISFKDLASGDISLSKTFNLLTN